MFALLEFRKKRKGKDRKYKAITAENFLNLGREMDIQFHEDQRTSNWLTLNKAALSHIKIKLSKVENEERILKAAREKRLYTREPP